MTVSETLSAYSTSVASNTPAGTDAVGTDLDDHLRNIKWNVKNEYMNQRGISSPDIVPGRFWYDTSGSGSALAILKIGDGGADIPLFQINESSNAAMPYFGTQPAGSAGAALAVAVTQASAQAAVAAVGKDLTLSAGPGLSGGGSLSASRAFALAINTLQTLTASATQTMVLPINDGSAERGVTMKNLIGSVVASQAQMETAVSSNAIVTALVQQYHPGHPKAQGRIGNDGTSATFVAGYGIASARRVSQGRVIIGWSTPFSTATYTVLGMAATGGGGGQRSVHMTAMPTVTSAELICREDTTSLRDEDLFIAAWGDQ